jgi:hypothetical protein
MYDSRDLFGEEVKNNLTRTACGKPILGAVLFFDMSF